MTGRRQFLGAAAALWNLPYGDQFRMHTETPPEDSQDGETEKDLPRRNRLGCVGGAVHAEEYCEIFVDIGLYPHQELTPVVLELVGCNGITMGVSFEPTEARRLAMTLVEAADDVERWRAVHWSDHQQARYGGLGTETSFGRPTDG